MKNLCALIGAFFLVAGLGIVIAGPPEARNPAVATARPARAGEHRPLLWEADVERSAPAAHAAEAVTRNR